jgi:hypothetical protein
VPLPHKKADMARLAGGLLLVPAAPAWVDMPEKSFVAQKKGKNRLSVAWLMDSVA